MVAACQLWLFHSCSFCFHQETQGLIASHVSHKTGQPLAGRVLDDRLLLLLFGKGGWRSIGTRIIAMQILRRCAQVMMDRQDGRKVLGAYPRTTAIGKQRSKWYSWWARGCDVAKMRAMCKQAGTVFCCHLR